jgi:outer membrane protein assembly factor BamB
MTAGGQSVPAEAGRAAPPVRSTTPAPPSPATKKPAASFGNRPEAGYELVWRVEKLPATTSAELVVTPATLITGGEHQPTTARRLTDGAVLWTSALVLRKLMAHAGRVYGVAGTQVAALDEQTGSAVWTARAADEPLALAATGGRLIVTGARTVSAYATEDGTLVWQADIDSAPATSPSAAGTIAVVGLEDRSVLVLELSTGALRWRHALDDTPRWVLATEHRIFVGLPKIAACAIPTVSGPPHDWCTFQVRVPSVGPPLLEDRWLFLALWNGSLITLNRETGTEVRSDNLEGRAAFQPGRIGADVVVPLTNSSVTIVSPAGTITRLSSPENLRVLQQAAITSIGTVVTLSTTMQEDMTLSAYRPKPAGTPASSTNAPAGTGVPAAPAAPVSAQPSASGSPAAPPTTDTPTPSPSGR